MGLDENRVLHTLDTRAHGAYRIEVIRKLKIEKTIIKKNGNTNYTVRAATMILSQFGIVKHEWQTRELIRKGELNARHAGNPKNRRAGYIIRESDIYELITSRIPAMAGLFDLIEK